MNTISIEIKNLYTTFPIGIFAKIKFFPIAFGILLTFAFFPIMIYL